MVTEKLESELEELAEIRNIESTSRAGVSFIGIELRRDIGPDSNEQVFSKIRDQLADAVPLLPPEAEEPIFDDRRIPVAFTRIFGLVWTGDGPAELGVLNRLGEELADRLRTLPGTELVRLYGAPEEEITVRVDSDALALLGMDAGLLAQRIAAADAKVPAGLLRGNFSDVQLEVSGELDSVERIAAIPILSGGSGDLVRVSDVAEVRREWRTPAREIGTVDGKRIVYVAARMRDDLRVDRWTAGVDQVLEGFEPSLGGAVVLESVFDQEGYTSSRLFELASNLVAGALVVVAIILLMMGWRSALVVATALPLTISLTFSPCR